MAGRVIWSAEEIFMILQYEHRIIHHVIGSVSGETIDAHR